MLNKGQKKRRNIRINQYQKKKSIRLSKKYRTFIKNENKTKKQQQKQKQKLKQKQKQKQKQKGGQLISLYNQKELKGINKPKQFNKTAKNSFGKFLVSPLIGKPLNNISNMSKYSSTSDCFEDLQNRFIKCYSKYEKDLTRKRECKTKLLVKSNECQQVPNKYAYSFGNNKTKKSLPELKTKCWEENVDKKARCFSVFHRNSIASSPGILGYNNPTRTCAKEFQKRIEFCQPTPEDTKKLFQSKLSKYKLFVSKNKIPYIDNEIISNLN
jgi:hypothetical protein